MCCREQSNMIDSAFVSGGYTVPGPICFGRQLCTRASSFTGPAFSPRVTRCRNEAAFASHPIRMISSEAARAAIAVYGVVVAGGGIGAFLRSGSKASIISGGTAGILLAAAYIKESVPLALCVAAALAVVFAFRLAKTKKFMPAGMLCILSLIAVAVFATSIYA